MRIALLSDVHGNAEALAAVLDAIHALAPDHVFALGDLIGRGPEPGRVLSMLEAHRIPRLRGNWEEWVERGDGSTPKRKAWVAASRALLAAEPPKNDHEKVWKAVAPDGLPDAAHGKLRKKPLDAAPETIALQLGGRRLVLAHGSPREITERLTACTSVETLREAIAGTAADVVAVGHSHHAFVKRVDGTLVVNCGSVGYAVVGDPRACFALVELLPDLPPSAELIRVPYPFARNLARMRRAEKQGHVPSDLARSYHRGLLGNGEEPREPLMLGDSGHGLLVKLLARPTRGLYRALSGAWPADDTAHVESAAAAARALAEALHLAAPTLGKRETRRALRRLTPLAAALSNRTRAGALASEVPEASVRRDRATRKLKRAAGKRRLIDHGLDLVACMMDPRDGDSRFGDVARTHLRARLGAIARSVQRIEDPGDTDGHDRLLDAIERTVATTRILGDTFGLAPALPALLELEAALRALRASNDAAAFRRTEPSEPTWRTARDLVCARTPAVVGLIEAAL